MANEYKLSYTAKEINEKLGKIDENSNIISDLEKDVSAIGKSNKKPITTSRFWYSNLAEFSGDTDELKAQNIAKYDTFKLN